MRTNKIDVFTRLHREKGELIIPYYFSSGGKSGWLNSEDNFCLQGIWREATVTHLIIHFINVRHHATVCRTSYS
jgi:hypothetical protein